MARASSFFVSHLFVHDSVNRGYLLRSPTSGPCRCSDIFRHAKSSYQDKKAWAWDPQPSTGALVPPGYTSLPSLSDVIIVVICFVRECAVWVLPAGGVGDVAGGGHCLLSGPYAPGGRPC